jgi:hypothetical protein
MNYYFKNKKKPAQAGETLGQALLCFALAMSAAALAIAIGAVVVCK